MSTAHTPHMRPRKPAWRRRPRAQGHVPADPAVHASPRLTAQRLARRVLGPTVRRLWPIELAGFDDVPAQGPVILCANHLSFFDSVFLLMTLKRTVYFIGKAEYLGSWKTRRLFPAMGMIPIDRDNGTRAMVALEAAADVLRGGAVLLVFPEGSRSRDGRLHRGYTGAARLAMSVGCPMLPVGITGTREIQPPGARLPRPRRACSISIGKPVIVEQHDASGTRLAARTLTDQMMQRIAELSGQDYDPHYTKRADPRRTPPQRQRHRDPLVAPLHSTGTAGPVLAFEP